MKDAKGRATWRERFVATYGAAPTLSATAPGRVNLIGEHVDYCEGVVLPVALRRGATVAARLSPDSLTRIRSSAFPERIEIDASSLRLPRPTGTFADRVLGVFEAFRRGPWACATGRACPVPPLEILIDSELPVGGGLSSSAAVEAAAALLAAGLIDAPGALLHGEGRIRTLAHCCMWAEHEAAGVPCGIMDMLASLAGRPGHATRIDCRDATWRQVPLPAALSVLVIDTGVRHDHAGGEYAARRRDCEEAAQVLGARTLRDVEPGAVRSPALSERQRRRARHVTGELCRVEEFVAALETGALDSLGALLAAGHRSLRDDFEVSCPELDRVVELAEGLAGHGALGARMTGGGFGGCVVVLVRAGREQDVGGRIARGFAQSFGRMAEWCAA